MIFKQSENLLVAKVQGSKTLFLNILLLSFQNVLKIKELQTSKVAFYTVQILKCLSMWMAVRSLHLHPCRLMICQCIGL